MAGLLFPGITPAVGADESTAGIVTPTRSEALALTREVSRQATIAASKETLSTAPVDRLAAVFSQGRQGVWCAGVAQFLAHEAKTRGWSAAYLDIGFSGTPATHAVTLLKTTSGWHVADAYLGRFVEDPYPVMIQKLRQGRRPTVNEFGARHRVIIPAWKRTTASRCGKFWGLNPEVAHGPQVSTCVVTTTAKSFTDSSVERDYVHTRLWMTGLSASWDDMHLRPFGLSSTSFELSGGPQVASPDEVLSALNEPPSAFTVLRKS